MPAARRRTSPEVKAQARREMAEFKATHTDTYTAIVTVAVGDDIHEAGSQFKATADAVASALAHGLVKRA